MKWLLVTACAGISVVLAGCGLTASAGQAPLKSLPGASTLPVPLTTPALNASETLTPPRLETPLPVGSPTPLTTLTPNSSPTPLWVKHTGGILVCPILLYHHIGKVADPNPYYVSREAFRLQMESLYAWGYTPITMTLFTQVLEEGGYLPPRPVVISFDDGYRDVYRNAFPVMEKLGFVGVFYLISDVLDTGSYVRFSELKKMAAAGWEFGNHSATHPNLTRGYSVDLVQKEIIQSQIDLEERLGLPLRTFSYPYGLTSASLKLQLKELGFLAAVGVGDTWRHRAKEIFFLGRSEVRGDYDLDDFAKLLPYAGNLLPTPSKTDDFIPR